MIKSGDQMMFFDRIVVVETIDENGVVLVHRLCNKAVKFCVHRAFLRSMKSPGGETNNSDIDSL